MVAVNSKLEGVVYTPEEAYRERGHCIMRLEGKPEKVNVYNPDNSIPLGISFYAEDISVLLRLDDLQEQGFSYDKILLMKEFIRRCNLHNSKSIFVGRFNPAGSKGREYYSEPTLEIDYRETIPFMEETINKWRAQK